MSRDIKKALGIADSQGNLVATATVTKWATIGGGVGGAAIGAGIGLAFTPIGAAIGAGIGAIVVGYGANKLVQYTFIEKI